MKNDQDILKAFSENKNIKRYQELEKIINKNELIKDKLTTLKKIQKEIVHAKSFGKTNALDKLESDYDRLYNEFLQTPLIAEYLELQVLINDLLQNFTSIIEDGIKSDLK